MSWLTWTMFIIAAIIMAGLLCESIKERRHRKDLERRISRKDGGL